MKNVYAKAKDLKKNSSSFSNLLKRMSYYKYIYLILLPGLVFLIIFKYVPMYGLQLAFKDYMLKGINASPWVGLEKFKFLMREREFFRAFNNTLIISFLKVAIGFPFPVILALLINEFRMPKTRRVLQIVYTFPHFLSWVIVSGIIFNLLGNSGVVNNILMALGEEKINFLYSKSLFRWLLVGTSMWKEAGWSTIIYMAAIAGIDISLYESAVIDGANRWHQIRYITWPSIKNVVIIMLILRIGHVMEAGFMQVFNMYNPVVYDVGDIIDTYVYRITFQKVADYGVSTAVGLFKGITNMILLLSANRIAKLFGNEGIM